MLCNTRISLPLRRISVALFFLFITGGLLSAQRLVMVSGNGQLVAEQALSNVPMVVQALDASGRPVPNVAINWSITQGQGTLSGSTLTTDSNGLASTSFLSTTFFTVSMDPEIVTASSAYGTVNFYITTVISMALQPQVYFSFIAPTPGAMLTGASGSTLPAAVSAQVVVTSGPQSGQPIPNVGLRLVDPNNLAGPPPATCAGSVGGVILTDKTGTATCNLQITGTPGQYELEDLVAETRYSYIYNLQITPGAACTFSLSASSQSFSAATGSGTVNVTTTSGCGWAAASNASFLTVTSGASGTGNGTVTYTVTANPGAARSGTLTIAGQTYTVNQSAGTAGALTITSAPNLPPGTINATYPGASLSATGGTPPYSWSVSSGSLPAGLTLNASTGFISGTPTAAGSSTFSATVRDNVGGSQTQSFTITINTTAQSGFNITNTSFPNGVVGQPYQQLLTTSGGSFTPFSQNPGFSITSGSLPAGLSISTNSDGSHSITGTPQGSGAFNFSLTATDAAGHSTTAGFTITITGTATSQQLVVSPTSLVFTVLAGSTTAPASQSVSLTANTGTLSYSSSASVASGGNWLAVTGATSGNTPGTLTVGVANFSKLAAGTYMGSITITSQASNSPISLGVSLTVLAAPTLTASPNTIGISRFAATSAAATRQDIQIASSGAAAAFTAIATTSTGGSWLTVSPGSATTPATISAFINPSGLAAGNYTGAIQIAPAAGPAITVTVALTVLPPATLVATPAPLSFAYQAGSAPPASATVGVTSTGAPIGVTASAATQSGGTWLFVNPASGTTSANLTVSVNPAGLAVGTYTGSITLTPSDIIISALTVPVTLIVSPGLSAVTSGASFAAGAVSPGEIITLFGTGIGPTTPATYQLDATGKLSTSLAGVQVLFDSTPAPLIYASSGQVSAIVPYEIAGKFSTGVQVVSNALTSAAVPTPVAPSAPAIFTTDASGQGAILNQDGSVNSVQNGAAPGSVVSIFATGEGVTTPAVADGSINPASLPLPVPVLNYSVQINGEPANVLYFGAAPGEPAGVLQVNAKVPADVARGSRVSVQITVGTVTSQQGVTLAIAP